MPDGPMGVEVLAARVVGLLRERDLTLATAESITGGLLAGAITAVPGASAVFRGGVVAYATDLKHRLLGVDDDLLARVGAVHGEVAEQMASGARVRLGADLAVATTGVAGPDSQDGHPPGEVWLGLSTVERTWHVDASPRGVDASQRSQVPGGLGAGAGRAAIRSASVRVALAELESVLRTLPFADPLR